MPHSSSHRKSWHSLRMRASALPAMSETAASESGSMPTTALGGRRGGVTVDVTVYAINR